MKRALLYLLILGVVAGAIFYLNQGKSNSTPSLSTEKSTESETPSSTPNLGSPDHAKVGTGEEETFDLEKYENEKQKSDAAYERAGIFESELTKADVDKITEGHPNSFFRRAGYFSTHSRLREKCTKEEYEKIKRKIPLETLHGHMGSIRLIISQYEFQAMPEYIKKIRGSWSTDSRWKEFRDLDEIYAKIGKGYEQTARTKEQVEEQTLKYESRIIKSGIPKDRVTEYVLDTASISPPCFVDGSSQIYDWIKKDVTNTRGRNLLPALKKYWAVNRLLPKKISELLPYGKNLKSDQLDDGWYNDFLIKEENALEFLLYSSGQDREPNTADDIRIGTFRK